MPQVTEVPAVADRTDPQADDDVPDLLEPVVPPVEREPVDLEPPARAPIDLEPFERLRDAAMGMTSHLLYTRWDPDRPASQSPVVIHDIIRQRIGFDGFLMSDDIGMEALAGDHGQRAAACVAEPTRSADQSAGRDRRRQRRVALSWW